VLWVSKEELILFRTDSKGVIYAVIVNIRRHTERKLTGLNKQFTETWSYSLGDPHLSPDGHRILWSVRYVEGSGTFTCNLNGKELQDWTEPNIGSHAYILGWLSNSHQWVRGVHKIKDPYTHLLIQDINPHRLKTTIPFDETVQITSYDDISFAESDTMVVFKNIHSDNAVHSLELVKLHIDSTVTVQARYTAPLPLGDTLIEVALSRNGRKIAVLVERRKLLETPKNPLSRDLKSDGVQYAMMVKNIDEAEFHDFNLSLPTPQYEERVLRPVFWGVSWSPDGDKLGYCIDDSVFVLRVAGADAKEIATYKLK
jgi:hypothetical protein